jgi:isopenicillin-N epimerase
MSQGASLLREMTMFDTRLGRRDFLGRLAATGGALAAAPALAQADEPLSAMAWPEFRKLFPLRTDRIHMACMVMTSHPEPVTRAIEMHRAALQADPVRTIDDKRWDLEKKVSRAAAHYFNVASDDIALTDSTSMATSFLYTGMRLKAGEEILTSIHDHFSTEMAIAECAARTGCSVKRIAMFDDPAQADENAMIDRVRRAITPQTRVVGLTWVHSATGVKIPAARIGAMIQEINRQRGEKGRIYYCVDGVHALGIEDFTIPDLNCDFFVAGTHKWLFGPRGTGVMWGRAGAWKITRPTIHTWYPESLHAWIGWIPEQKVGGGWMMTRGGYHSFEHQWALDAAFELHEQLGKRRVQDRIHALNTRLKQGLKQTANVRLFTPMSESLSSGIACFMVGSLPAQTVVDKLFERRIVASVTPYKASYARLTPGLMNSEAEVDEAIAAVRAIANV